MGLISNGSTIFDAGSLTSGFGGNMSFIKKLTASSSATLSFVDGTDGVDFSIYKEYVFTFNNMHPATDNASFEFNVSIDGGSNYNVVKTTTSFQAYHLESDAYSGIEYNVNYDLAQSTAFQIINYGIGNDNDENMSGTLNLYNPSSTTFVKHFMVNTNNTQASGYAQNFYVAGYGNTTSAIDAVRFQMSSGNIDSGDICLYGIA